MSLGAELELLRDAVQALREAFPADPGLHGQEGLDQYGLEREVGADWLREKAGALAAALLVAGFTVDLRVAVGGRRVALPVDRDVSGSPRLSGGEAEVDEEAPALAPEALEAVTGFLTSLEPGRKVPLSELAGRLERLAERSVSSAVRVRVFLNKQSVNLRLESPDVHVLSFLFQERLRSLLEEASLADLEGQYFEKDIRTLIVVSDLRGGMFGDFLAVCGWDQAAEIESFLSQRLPVALLQAVQKTLDFRNDHCNWDSATDWLTPDFFAFHRRTSTGDAADALAAEIESFKALLAVAFLARRTRDDAVTYEVRFGDQARGSLWFRRADIKDHKAFFDDLYGLYRFAYDGFSGDKVEIVRQTLSLAVSDLASLFERARQAREAAEKSHGRYLEDRVAEYFGARRKVQDYVQEVVRAAENATLKLAEDLAGNAYKTLAVIALAAVADILKPDLSDLAACIAASVLSVYLGLVAFFYMPAVRQVGAIRRRQYEEHIRTFEDFLGDAETEAALQNPNVQEAWSLFDRKEERATQVYAVLFFLALFVALYYLRPALGAL